MNGERRLNQREAEAWRALGWLFDHGETERSLCAELTGVRDEELRRRMHTRLRAWFGPSASPEIHTVWWPLNHKHRTPAERRDGLQCRALCCGFLAAMATAGDPLFPEESNG